MEISGLEEQDLKKENEKITIVEENKDEAIEENTLNRINKCMDILDNDNYTQEIKNTLLQYLANPESIQELINEEDIFDLFIEKFKKKYL